MRRSARPADVEELVRFIRKSTGDSSSEARLKSVPARCRWPSWVSGTWADITRRVAQRFPGSRSSASTTITRVGAEEVAREGGLAVLAGPDEVAEKAEAVIVATPTYLARGSLPPLPRARPRRPGGEAGHRARGGSLGADRPGARAVAGARRRPRRAYNPAVEAVAGPGPRAVFIEGHRLGVFTPRSLDVDVVLDLMIHDLQIVADLVSAPCRRDPRRRHARAHAPDRHRQRADRFRGRLCGERDGLAGVLGEAAEAPRVRALALLLDRHARPHGQCLRAFAGQRRARDRARRGRGRSYRLARPGAPGLRRSRAGAARPPRFGRGRPDALALAHRVLAAIEEHARGAASGDA